MSNYIWYGGKSSMSVYKLYFLFTFVVQTVFLNFHNYFISYLLQAKSNDLKKMRALVLSILKQRQLTIDVTVIVLEIPPNSILRPIQQNNCIGITVFNEKDPYIAYIYANNRTVFHKQ